MVTTQATTGAAIASRDYSLVACLVLLLLVLGLCIWYIRDLQSIGRLTVRTLLLPFWRAWDTLRGAWNTLLANCFVVETTTPHVTTIRSSSCSAEQRSGVIARATEQTTEQPLPNQQPTPKDPSPSPIPPPIATTLPQEQPAADAQPAQPAADDALSALSAVQEEDGWENDFDSTYDLTYDLEDIFHF